MLLCVPLTTSRLSGGVDGDQFGLHVLWWYTAEAASPSFLHSAAEWSVHAMYELLQGHHDGKTEADDDAIGSDAFTSHMAMATLSPQSFSAVSSLTRLHDLAPPHPRRAALYSLRVLSAPVRSAVLPRAAPGAAAAVQAATANAEPASCLRIIRLSIVQRIPPAATSLRPPLPAAHPRLTSHASAIPLATLRRLQPLRSSHPASARAEAVETRRAPCRRLLSSIRRHSLVSRPTPRRMQERNSSRILILFHSICSACVCSCPSTVLNAVHALVLSSFQALVRLLQSQLQALVALTFQPLPPAGGSPSEQTPLFAVYSHQHSRALQAVVELSLYVTEQVEQIAATPPPAAASTTRRGKRGGARPTASSSSSRSASQSAMKTSEPHMRRSTER